MDILYIGIIVFIICIILYLSFLYFYSDNNDDSNLETKMSTISGSISNIMPNRSHMKLSQYCIKSSYNTAYDGSTVSTKMITNVINAGCRFLDLEIFSVDGVPSVGYSIDPTFTNLNSKNSISLTDAFTAIMSNAFSSMYCGNPKDPLFIQLRIKSNDKNNIYKSVASSIDAIFGNSGKLHVDSKNNPIPVNANTTLADLKGHVIFIIDKSINPDYASYAHCYSGNCYDLTKYINMESGGNTFRLMTYGSVLTQQMSPPVIMDDFVTTNATNVSLAVPDPVLNVKNPLVFDYIVNYGIQNIAYQFWNKDKNLVIYESVFNEYKTSFVPFAYAIQYFKNLHQNLNTGIPVNGVNS